MRPARPTIVASLLFAVFALAGVPVGHAQQPPPDAISRPSVELSPAQATVGDHLTLTVRVRHRDDVTVSGPGFGADYGGLELLDVAPPTDDERGDGSVRTTFVYTLTAFETGAFTVPPLPVTYNGAGGGATVMTDPVTVAVNSVLAPGDTSLRPLKPQFAIGEAAPTAAAPALFVAVFAVLTAVGYVLHARVAAIAPPKLRLPETPPEPPDVRARAALAEAGRLAASDPAEGYARIATAVRRYLSERFGFPAYAMTRTELERAMTAAGIDRWPARLTANLLEQCDAVQFAGFRPAPERRAADLTAAHEIVDLTCERPAGERDQPET